MDETTVSYKILRVEGDPVSWVIECADADALARQLGPSSPPVAVTAVSPLAGTLVLSPRRAGSIAVTTLPPAGGWMPSETLKAPTLYVPSATGPTSTPHGYVLAPGTDLDDLQQQIMAAMHSGGGLTVPVSFGGGFGQLQLNGTALPLVVLCPADASPKPNPADPVT
jgi:hypothetical protein